MKFKKLLAAMTVMLASTVFFCSCGSDDESIEGSWKVASLSEELIINGKTVASESDSFVDEEHWLIFKGGTLTAVYRETDDGETYVGYNSSTYTVDGDKLEWVDDGYKATYKYKISGSKLTLTKEVDAVEGSLDDEEISYYAKKYNIKEVKSIKFGSKAILNKVSDSEVPAATELSSDIR